MKNNTITKLRCGTTANYIVESSLIRYENEYTATNFSLKYVERGVENYNIDNKWHNLSANNFMVVNPGQAVELNVKSSAEVLGHCYFFDIQLLSQIKYAYQKTIVENLDHIEIDNTCDLFLNIPTSSKGTLFHNCLNRTFYQELIAPEQRLDFLISLAENLVIHATSITKNIGQLESNKKMTRLELYRRIQMGRHFIHDNYRRSIALSDMARAANLSEFYFHRNFRKFFGATPHNYLKRIRMDQARLLFERKEYTLTEVADLCGFNDPKYFSKVYRKWRN